MRRAMSLEEAEDLEGWEGGNIIEGVCIYVPKKKKTTKKSRVKSHE